MARAERRKFHYIYKITRTDGSGKYYIGMHSTDDLEDGYFGSGQLLWKSIDKHGKDKHAKEILEFLPSRKELKERERELVNEEILYDPLCMNLKLGGEGGWDHIDDAVMKNIRRKNIAAARESLYANPSKFEKYCKIQSDKMKLNHLEGKIRYDTFTGCKHSDDVKRQIGKANSIHQTGAGNSQFGTCWITNGVPIKIKKERLEEYLKRGYRRGRK